MQQHMFQLNNEIKTACGNGRFYVSPVVNTISFSRNCLKYTILNNR